MLESFKDWSMHCFECGKEYGEEPASSLCDCGGVLELVLNENFPTIDDFRGVGVWRYSSALPISRRIQSVTMDEGNTPLIRTKNLVPERELQLFVKNEGQNPTGSFKDRGMTVAVTRARGIGANTLVCASTGNTSASAAAYAARAGMRAMVFVPSLPSYLSRKL